MRDETNNRYTPWPEMGQAMRVYSEHGPSPTVAHHHILVTQEHPMTDQPQPQPEAMPIQGTMIGRSDTAGPAGPGYGEEGDPMYTLDTVSRHAVAQPIVFENSYRDGPRVGDDLCHTLSAKMGTGGGNTPMVAETIAFVQNQRDEVRDLNDLAGCLQAEPGMKQQTFIAQPVTEPTSETIAFNTYGGNKRPDRPEGGFYVEEAETSKTLSCDGLNPSANQGGTVVVQPVTDAEAVNFDEYNFTGGEPTHHSIRAGTRQSTGVVQPTTDTYVADSVLSFDTQFGSNANVFEDLAPPLKASQAPPSFHETIERSDTETVVTAAFKPGASAGARSIGYEEEIAPTLEAGGGGNNRPAIVTGVVAPPLTASNDPSRSPQSSEVTQQVGAVFEATMVVRRLTPVECERLMGWPDDHTRWTAEGAEVADSHRYKMCGNGVASPVAEWVGRRLMGLMGEV